MQVGFCVTSGPQGVTFHRVGRESLKGLLTFYRTTDTAVIVLGRLHYRREVLDSLKEPLEEDVDDAGLVLAVYEQLGPDALCRLEGCFALAIWDIRRQRLLARRDVLGGFPVYWGKRGESLAVATSLDAVREWVSSDTLDPEFQAEYLMLPCCGQHETACERTPYRNVQRLLPTTLLEADTTLATVSLRRYWDWLDQLHDPGTHDIRALADCYLDLLRQAVRDRMQGTTAAHLSGGMDSTSVTLLALSEIDSGTKRGPLHTLSLTYDRMQMLARERPVIEAAVQGRPNIEPHFLAADDLLDFGHFENPPYHEEPWPWLSMVEMEVARVDAAEQLGAQTVLTGQGADELLDMGPYHLTDRLRRGRLLQAWLEAGKSARAENCGVWPILYPFGVSNLLPLSIRDGVGPLLRGGRAGWMDMGESTIPPWIRPKYARRFRLRDRAREHVRRTFHTCPSTVLSVALSKIVSRSGDLGRWYLSSPRGILVEHPFLDPRLLRFLLSVHAHVPPRPRTTPKPILTEAVRGILPEAIRLRPKGGFFNEPYYRGIAHYLPAVQKMVRQCDTGPLDWIDRDALQDCLRQSALGIGNDRIQLDRINLTLSWLRWLSLPRTNLARPSSVVYSQGDVSAGSGEEQRMRLPASMEQEPLLSR